MLTSRLCAALVVAAASVLAGCPSEPARSPTITRPIDEGHACGIIVQVFNEFTIAPERNRIIHIGDGGTTELKLDIAAQGQSWGIAYLTNQEGDRLSSILPVRKDVESFVVMDASGPGEKGQRGIIFYAGDYLTDDLSGDAHTSTTIAAEAKLQRDTREAIRTAKREGWQ
jgi:hypothetical protein